MTSPAPATGLMRCFLEAWIWRRNSAAPTHGSPLLYARSRIVHAAARIGVDAIDVPFLDLEDPEGMVEAATLARDLGFSGKGSIHPKQIAALNEVFTPDDATVARARPHR